MKNISVCIGSACHINGSYALVQHLKKIIEEKKLGDAIELVGSFCMGRCTEGVAVKYKEKIYTVSLENADAVFKEIMEEK